MDSIKFKDMINVKFPCLLPTVHKKNHTLHQQNLVLAFTPTSFTQITPLVNKRATGCNIKPLHFAHAQYNYRVRKFQKGNRLFPDTA